MKNERQELILDLITNQVIETQEQLIDLLRERGVTCTQATISRDIKQLHIVKETSGGAYRYAVSPQRVKLNFAGRLQNILLEGLVGAECAQNLIVLKTMPGLANAAGAAFDGMDLPKMLGCLSGDDTVLLVMRDNRSAAELCDEIEAMRKKYQK